MNVEHHIRISSQCGCGMGCQSCKNHALGQNLSLGDFSHQINKSLINSGFSKGDTIRATFGCSGEPTFNNSIILSSLYFFEKYRKVGVLFVPTISTMMPYKNKRLEAFLKYWMTFKNQRLSGRAGLIIRLNSQSPMAYSIDTAIKILLRVVDAEGVTGERIMIVTNDKRPEDYKRLFNPKYFKINI